MTSPVHGSFASRHIGPRPDEIREMLAAIGTPSLAQLIDEVVPADIRLERPMRLPEAESEADYLRRLREIASRNVVARSYIGLGYHDTVTPACRA